ncbi:MAG: HAMP domain-containing sensor histidine kinase [Chloroflexota bacterium]
MSDHHTSHTSDHTPGPHRPWQAWMHEGSEGDWRKKRRFLFFRFAAVFGVMTLLVVGGMAAVAFLMTRVLGGTGQTAILVWITGCGLSLTFPILAMSLGMRAFRRIATPLANVMAAADTVAEGDFAVEVPEQGPGEFRRLARSFNRMTAELARADEQRRNLTADVAHELRTPLHIIQGNLEGILDGVYEPTSDHIEATLDETRLLARLVADLRVLSLAEAGQLPLKKEAVDIHELLLDIETSFTGQAEVADIELKVVPANPHPLIIMGDVERLDQVLSNLVVNALRHTAAGGSITLQTELRIKDVLITVRDNGEGIPADDVPFIFDRFWRGDRARSHTGGVGGGLGLAIARQLVQAHGGIISVESEVGQGTTFTIQLPQSNSLPTFD